MLKQNQAEWIPIPDVTYISDGKLPLVEITDSPCLEIPELVIDIISPGQSFGTLIEKATAYLDAGIPQVWVVDPIAKSITVFYPDSLPRTLTRSDPIQDDLLPGLTVIPQSIFDQAGIP